MLHIHCKIESMNTLVAYQNFDQFETILVLERDQKLDQAKS